MSWNYNFGNINSYNKMFRALIAEAATNASQLMTSDPTFEPYTDDSESYIKAKEGKVKHEAYLWLLIFDLLIFIILTFTTYSSSKKLATTTTNSEDFRPKFIKGLVWANASKQFYLL
jgi:hypothetical protein